MGIKNTGIKRRAKLIGEALRPPGPAAGGQRQEAAKPGPGQPKQAAQAAQAKQGQQGKKAQGKRPEKRTVDVEYTVPIRSREVESPAFVIAPVRSGSTLLRMLLNSHSRIRAPHELHLRTVGVQLTPGFSDKSMRELDLDQAELEHVLWDRVLKLELERSGKDVIVDKTPGNVWTWERLHHAWPRAKFLFLLRHPEGVVSSLENRKSNTATREQLEANALKYFEPLERARQTLDGLTVRYEDLTAEPEKVTRELCAYLGQAWEPGMLDYGEQDQGPLGANLGDRSANIKSGRIQTPRELDASRLSPKLTEYATIWGYS